MLPYRGIKIFPKITSYIVSSNQIVVKYSVNNDINSVPGKYNIVCKGAQSGSSTFNKAGGKGSYVSAIFTIREQKTFHVIIGNKGISSQYGEVSRGMPDGGPSLF